MTKRLASFRKCESGATAIEYGMIAMFIAVVIIASVAAIGTGLEGIFSFIGGELAP